ncbi:MAG: hypothetical protein IJL89_05015, partial [Firmicutes bacterium]|nr:hypothetical protein [Bacillota bacterium]
MPRGGNIAGEKQAFLQYAVVADTRDKRVEALKQSLDGSAAIQAIDCAPAKLSLGACREDKNKFFLLAQSAVSG